MTFVFNTINKRTVRHIYFHDARTRCGLITSAWWMLGAHRSLEPPTDHYVDCKLCHRSLRTARRSQTGTLGPDAGEAKADCSTARAW
jgi:hypothetical protein